MAIFYGYTQTITEQNDTRDGGGGIVSRNMTISTYVMPNRCLTREQKDTYVSAPLGDGFSGEGLKLNKSDVKERSFETFAYGPNGPLNQPKPVAEVTRTFGWFQPTEKVNKKDTSPSDVAVWREIARNEVSYDYDGLGQLKMQSTTKLVLRRKPGFQFNTQGGYELTPDTLTVKSLSAPGRDWTATTTDTYSWSTTKQKWTSAAEASGDIHVGAGHRPGGVKSGG